MAQTMLDERPSLTRMLSCRHSKKVSCETLSLTDAYLHDNLQSETQSFYYSDDEKDHMKVDSIAADADEANELENPNYNYCKLATDYLQHVRQLENRSGKLDNPSYGDGKAARDNFLSRFLSKVSHMSAPSRAKEAERLKKHLRTRRTGGVLSQSGPILLHIGSSHSGALNSKAPATLRASSIIPRNAVTGKMNTSAGEPCSPKVTCLGRVRNKQKHSGMCTSVVSNDSKDNQVDVCCTSMLSRREKKKADTDVSNKEKKTSRMGSGNAMVVDHPNAQSKKTDCDKALKKLTAQSSGGKSTASSRLVTKEESKIWSSREITKHEESEIPCQNQQSCQATEASALGALSSEFSVDLSRFGSESQRHHEMMVASLETSLVGNDWQRFGQDDKEFSVDLSRFGSESQRRHEMMVASAETSLMGNNSQRYGQDDKEFSVDLSRFGSESQRHHEMMAASSVTSNDSQRFGREDKNNFVQAPPKNALLLIRNRKANNQPEVASPSEAAAALPNGQETSLPAALDDHVMNKTTSTQLYRPTSRLHRYDQELLPLSDVEMKKPVTIAYLLGHTSPVATCGPSMACKSEKFERKCSLQTEHSGVHRQASLPKPSPESSIWQRRAIEKPCALDIKKPIRAESKQRTIM